MERKKSLFPLADRFFQPVEMFSLTRYEKGIVVFLAVSIVLGCGLLYFQKINSKPPPAISRPPSFYKDKLPVRSGRTAFVIDINKADSRDLTQLSGIGPVLAQRIIDYRSDNGTFKQIDEIKNISGIGNKKFERIKEFLVLE